MRTEYRVAYKREGLNPKSKDCGNSRARAERSLAFFQGRYQESYPDSKPDAYVCCSGYQCGCGGKTWAERWAEMAESIADYPPLEYVRIETRQVPRWSPL
jgi:hypothetical protein